MDQLLDRWFQGLPDGVFRIRHLLRGDREAALLRGGVVVVVAVRAGLNPAAVRRVVASAIEAGAGDTALGIGLGCASVGHGVAVSLA